jgi:hypothetical protein
MVRKWPKKLRRLKQTDETERKLLRSEVARTLASSADFEAQIRVLPIVHAPRGF